MPNNNHRLSQRLANQMANRRFPTLWLSLVLATYSSYAEVPHKQEGTDDIKAQVAPFEYVGYAYDVSSGKLVYTEHHQEFFVKSTSNKEEPIAPRPLVKNSQLITNYRAPNGQIIATRKVEYKHHPLTPQFEFNASLVPVTEGLKVYADRFKVYHKYQQQSKQEKNIPIDIPIDTPTSNQNFVADAGFVQFIHANWQRLIDGDLLKIQFIAPSLLKPIRMRVKYKTQGTLLNQPSYTFVMEVDNRILNWFVDPIEVSFHQKQRTLLQYVGLSNVPKSADKNYLVRINFPDHANRRLGAQHE